MIVMSHPRGRHRWGSVRRHGSLASVNGDFDLRDLPIEEVVMCVGVARAKPDRGAVERWSGSTLS